jgi:3-oxoacyl-[acyl-carrier protein] reductase
VNLLGFKSLKIGQRFELFVDVTEEFVSNFAEFSGDTNPIHMDASYASRTRYRRRVAHGLSFVSMFSKLVGMNLPGPVIVSQKFDYKRPSYIGDKLTLSINISTISQSTNTVSLSCSGKNQDGEVTLSGEIAVLISEPEPESDQALETFGPNLILVVGGSRGIGASVVRRMAEDGHMTAFTYNSSDADAQNLENEFSNCVGFRADASDKGSAKILANALQERFGKLPNVFVHCVSASPSIPKSDLLDFRPYVKHLEMGLGFCHELLGYLLPEMVENNYGNIVVLGTTYTEVAPPPGTGPYLVGKSALTAFAKSIAVDHGQHGIRANVVAPSMTETSFLAGMPDRELKVAAYRNPMRRLAVPSDIAGVISFLISEDSAYINGQTLIVSGGSVIN